ncbi:OmpA family protein [uncultured Porphyromonas sp.]|uniref:OmpA family protein n=1 Tax=uncultured Porphyromonas sp. TaxID=159274 RepID=UPI0026235DFF|nr:OmpA family protein [uncultured Porphyromonas sp.]
MPRTRIIPLLLLFGWALVVTGCSPRLEREAELAERRGEYHRAAELYRRLYTQTPAKQASERARLAFRAGENARRTRAVASAHTSYLAALRHHYPDSLLLLRLSETSLGVGAPEQARAFALRYLSHDSTSREARRVLESTSLALSHNPSTTAHSIYKVERADHLSSTRSDYGVTYSPEGKVIYLTSTRPLGGSSKSSSPITGEGLGRIYALRQGANGIWERRLDTLAGLGHPQSDLGTPTLSPDGRTMYLTLAVQGQEGTHTARIYRSTLGMEGRWSEAEPVDLLSDSTVLVAHPSLSPSGRVLFFVSDLNSGKGGKDLYRVELVDGIPGALYNLGAEVNTPSDELYPYAVSDSLLYFASDGHVGLGGLDIYRAQLLPSGHYEVTHIPAPINSPADDYGLAPTPRVSELDPTGRLLEVGFLASSRDDQRGRPHLYRFERARIETLIEGLVLDREGYPIPGATLRLVGNTAEDQIRAVTTDAEGSYRLSASADIDYVMLASAPGYLNQYVRLHTDPSDSSEVYTVDFYLTSRETTEQLRELYYAFDSAEILPESTPALEALLRLLEDNPEVVIELTAHADRIGSDSYNTTLSERRARSVLSYLTSRGIAEGRLHSRGYGKSHPFVVTRRVAEEYPFLEAGQVLDEAFIATLPEEQQAVCDALNRRTELRVLPAREPSENEGMGI